MSAIIKTWPAFMEAKKVLRVFEADWGRFYFTLGRGKPKDEVQQIWFTHRGRILGHFEIEKIVRNTGDNLPPLRSLSGEVSEWQIKLMNYVAVCRPPMHRLDDRLYHEGFRGWRYFDIAKHRGSLDAKVRL